jgi:hypothetical protein
MPAKVIIAGGRDFNDFRQLEAVCNHHLSKLKDVEIVSGMANGADKLGERYAKKHKLPVKRFPAKWKTNGKAAGHIRNKEMADYSDMLIAFWDKQSSGTGNMIELAKSKGIEVVVSYYCA